VLHQLCLFFTTSLPASWHTCGCELHGALRAANLQLADRCSKLQLCPHDFRLGRLASLSWWCYSYKGYFVDLFVRKSNDVAVDLYTKLGYVTYRTVLEYYSGGADEEAEDAYDMRKALSADTTRQSMIPLPEPITPWEIESTM
jgi:hypothetical protein